MWERKGVENEVYCGDLAVVWHIRLKVLGRAEKKGRGVVRYDDTGSNSSHQILESHAGFINYRSEVNKLVGGIVCLLFSALWLLLYSHKLCVHFQGFFLLDFNLLFI